MTNKKIKEELLAEVKKESEKIGKNISWFQFAKKRKERGLTFLKNRDPQFNILMDIIEKFIKKYPKFNRGQIADLLSDLVNN